MSLLGPGKKIAKKIMRIAFFAIGMVLGMALLVALSAFLMKTAGPVETKRLLQKIHWLGPVALVAQIASVLIIWHHWEQIVRSHSLSKSAQAVWLGARNRVAVWGLVYSAFATYLLVGH